MIRFESDYTQGATPEIIKRLTDTNMEMTPGYGEDHYCEAAAEKIKNEIKNRGYNKISHWVLEENDRARRFYEKSGFIVDGKYKPSGLADAREVRYICKCAW